MSAPTVPPSPSRRRFDPFLDDPWLRAVYRALLSARWDEFLAGFRADATGWLVPYLLTSEEAAVETVVFRHLVESRPSALALALLGAARARDAWTLAGGRPAVRAVATEDRNEFEARMVEAEVLLHEAVAIEPEVREARVHLLTTGAGLRHDAPELRRRFEDVHLRHPFRPDATLHYLHALGPSGVGRTAALFDFVRWIQDEAPPSSAARLALPAAHLEHGLAGGPRALTRHLSRRETVEELADGLDLLLEALPDPVTPEALHPLNAFALAMTVVDQRTAALTSECFRRIAGRPTAYPWALYQEDIASVFAEVRASQLRSVTRFGGRAGNGADTGPERAPSPAAEGEGRHRSGSRRDGGAIDVGTCKP